MTEVTDPRQAIGRTLEHAISLAERDGNYLTAYAVKSLWHHHGYDVNVLKGLWAYVTGKADDATRGAFGKLINFYKLQGVEGDKARKHFLEDLPLPAPVGPLPQATRQALVTAGQMTADATIVRINISLPPADANPPAEANPPAAPESTAAPPSTGRARNKRSRKRGGKAASSGASSPPRASTPEAGTGNLAQGAASGESATAVAVATSGTASPDTAVAETSANSLNIAVNNNNNINVGQIQADAMDLSEDSPAASATPPVLAAAADDRPAKRQRRDSAASDSSLSSLSPPPSVMSSDELDEPATATAPVASNGMLYFRDFFCQFPACAVLWDQTPQGVA
jgi:hypothetical protein